jgi:hypothetical protein
MSTAPTVVSGNASASSDRGGSTSYKSNKSATLAYLTSYETMVRMQDDECERTSEFVKGAMERVRLLGMAATNAGATNANRGSNDEATPEGMLTYLEMRRALLRLGFTWNRSIPSQSSYNSPVKQYYDDDNVSIASETSKSSRVSGASGKVLGGKQVRKKRDVVATDNQLIMLLSILVEMEERWRVDTMDSNNGDTNQHDTDVCARGLFLPELVQAYKLVIGGMQSLQTLNRDGNNRHNNNTSSSNSNYKSTNNSSSTDMELSERLRERTKSLLKSFGPDHKLSMHQITSTPLFPYTKTKSGKSRDGLSLSPTKQQLFPSPTRVKTKALADAAFAQPRLCDDSIRKLMHTKDAALAKIVEEHEVEMDIMVNDLEVLKEKEMSSREILVKKRKRTRVVAALGAILIVGAGGYWERERRAWVNAQIAKGRQEERLKSYKEIERLTIQRDGLKKELDTAEGTARYQHSRLEELEVATNRTVEEIASVEQKWWLEQAEMGRCKSEMKEMEVKIDKLSDSVLELQEEQGWCSNRLQGRDSELNSLRYAKSDYDNNSDRSLSAAGGAAGARSFEQLPKNDKPVKLEMKYNKSVRNAMILRQVYSGAGGVAASFALRAIFPQFFAFFTLPALKEVAPAAKKAVVAAPKKLGVNVKWVDRIHVATVVLLVLRTAVLFFMP